jgi:hypothetical protein
MDNVPTGRRTAARKTCVGPAAARRWARLAAALVCVAAPALSVAQDAGAPNLQVAPAIVATDNSEAVLAVQVGPLGATPPRAFVSLRGLPPAVSLRDGHSVGPGSWAVPISALPSLRARIPVGLSGRSEIVISLIAMDGRLLAQARSTMLIEPASPQAALALSPGPAPGATTPLAGHELGDEQREQRARAERLLARGEALLANGNILGARDFFERAADAGLGASALQLGGTYDPVELKRLKVQGVAPDPVLARKWYERARDLGASEAAGLLARLGKS